MRRSATIRILAVVFILLLFLTGCKEKDLISEPVSSPPPAESNKPAPQNTQESVHIKFGYIDDFHSNTTAHINIFNRSNSSIQIEPIKYDSFEDLSFDIIAGNIPDMICTQSHLDPMRLYAAKNILLPLTEYVDQLNSNDLYFDNVLRSEQINGEIFYITPTFDLSGFACPTELLSKDAKIQTLEKLDKLFSADDASIYGHMRKLDMLNNLLTEGLPLFVDYKSKTVDFQTEAFCDILQYCERFLDENVPPSTDTFPLFRFIRVNSSDQLRSYAKSQSKYTPHGQEISYLPMPFSTYNGMAIKGNLYLGISSQTENTDACYKILDYFFSESVQKQMSSQQIGAIPALRTAVPACPTDTTSTYSVDFDALLLELIENADHHSGSYYADIQSIIADEAKYYFSGDKSLEDTVSLIQNRAEIYLAELG